MGLHCAIASSWPATSVVSSPRAAALGTPKTLAAI